MASTRPNILLVTSHDIGKHLGCYGIPGMRTPNLDRLAAEGVRFAHAFCTQSQCSPSRASLYTGRYPHSNGVMGLTHGAFEWDLHPAEKHLATVLKEAGYRTALAGLQHETGRPEAMGFDTIRIDRREAHWAAEVVGVCEELLDEFARTPEAPFYLQVGFFEGHRAPGHPNHEWGPMPPDEMENVTVPGYLIDDEAAREEFAQMQGSIRSLDAAIGTLLGALAARGMVENTLVIFTADHGIPFPRAKTSVYDPGIEVALMLRWPAGPVSAGQVCEELVSNVDVLPTLMDLLGLPTPPNVQGQSFAGLARGEAGASRTEVFAEMTYHNYADPMRCMRTSAHKLIANFVPCANVYNSTQQWRPRVSTLVPARPKNTTHVPLELYDLAKDPWEHVNVIDDPAYAAVAGEMRSGLLAWMRRTGDPLLEGIPAPPMHAKTLGLLGGA